LLQDPVAFLKPLAERAAAALQALATVILAKQHHTACMRM
jgi:hypothetical protein